MVRGNVIVGQSGGPTSVINSSLAGVFKTAKDNGIKHVYGMRNGIEGFLAENLINLTEIFADETKLGSCGEIRADLFLIDLVSVS